MQLVMQVAISPSGHDRDREILSVSHSIGYSVGRSVSLLTRYYQCSSLVSYHTSHEPLTRVFPFTGYHFRKIPSISEAQEDCFTQRNRLFEDISFPGLEMLQ